MPIKRLSRLNRLRLEEERKAEGRAGRRDRRASWRATTSCATIVVRELRRHRRRASAGRAARRSAARCGASRSAAASGPMTVVAQPRTDIWVCSTASRRQRGVAAGDAASTASRSSSAPATGRCVPLATDTEADLNAFAADGTVYRVRAAELPVVGAPVQGRAGRRRRPRRPGRGAGAAGARGRLPAAGDRARRGQARRGVGVRLEPRVGLAGLRRARRRPHRGRPAARRGRARAAALGPRAERCASSWTGCGRSRARAPAASPACGSTAATRSWP